MDLQRMIRDLLHAHQGQATRQHGMKLMVVHPSRITSSIGISFSQRLHLLFSRLIT